MRAYRWSLFLALEAGFASFAIENGRAAREKATREQTAYIRANAPAKYADSLVPTTVLGCKRKVMDTGYLACLHKPNVELLQNDPIARIEEDGVVTRAGRTVRADAIVLANGFRTQQPLFPMEIVGEGGESLEAHWDRVNEGGPCAYYGTQVAGFPNFFVLMGPNTVTGHLSVLFSTECQIDYINRVIEPVLTALRPSRVVSARGLLGLGKPPDVVAVREEAERAEVEWVERMTRGLVWATGCSSWGVDEKTGKNTMMYPDWQVKFWLRSVFVRWRDLAYSRSEEALERARRETKIWPRYVTLILLAAAMVGGRKAVGLGYVERFSEVLRGLVSDGMRTLMNVAPERLKG
ncbi:hypothetical protein MPH_01722 [Macrophomina phaseolina MS6]|uniref:Uncharacterized protein n=1 Tax=Macrophomina phaseolina (strain MS6) TaxID=1126212 RepID=K2SWM9_MACPH|nr:hypothetical protein MPH_01722 [Macrophomina phaseolina MS6]